MTDNAADPNRPANPLRDSALAALAGVAFLGSLVFLACAWGYADAGHPRWAGSFVVMAAACAVTFRSASKLGSGKSRVAQSRDRVALERVLPLPPGMGADARATLRQEVRRVALRTGGWFGAGAFGMLTLHYAAAGRPEWSAVAAACSAVGAGALAYSRTTR